MQKDIEVTLYGVKVKELSPKTYIKHVSSRSLLWNILSITQNLLANNSKNTKQPSTWLPSSGNTRPQQSMLSLDGSTLRSLFAALFIGLMKPERRAASSLHSPSCVSIASLRKGCLLGPRLLNEAGIPGYPYWAWKVNYQESLPLLKKYRENSLPSDSEEMRRIREAARNNKIFVSLGYSEVDLASLYTTQIMINPAGDIINHRRKIKATHVERLVFGDGTGDTTESVMDTEIGRIGHLNCWENMNPFLKAYAASLGEQVHVAAWPLYPGKETLKYPDPYTNIAEANADVSFQKLQDDYEWRFDY
jgi:hypothetical protein